MEKMETRTENQNKHSSRFLCLNLAMTYIFVLRGSITWARIWFGKSPKTKCVFFCPGSYLPLSPSHCCLLTFPRVWVIVITFSEVPNHLATSRGKSNIFGHENHPELTSMPLQSYTWPFAKFGLCQLKCIRDPLELQEFRKYFDLLS